MKITSKAIFLLLVATPSTTFAMEPCLDLESLDFPDCEVGTIFQTIKVEFSAVRKSCEHNARKETMLLANMPTLSQAKYALRNYCLGIEPCIQEWTDFGVQECTFDTVANELQDLLPGSCEHDAAKELQILFGAKNFRDTKRKVGNMCGEAWEESVETVPFTEVDSRFSDEFMDNYVAGDTFLNTETGSFQGTTEGQNIDNFRNDEATHSMMKNFPALGECEFNSIMCCFGRDRQPDDNNGNCATPLDQNCVDADPADNSNLCYTDFDLEPFPGAEEGDIHCHGLAWADDENDSSAKLKFNNFFYVSLYDHMYTRGYVENMIDSDNVPMCGCIEDMPPVSRADCTETAVNTIFDITWGDHHPEASLRNEGDYEFDYNECQGINPSTQQPANNDLASHVHRLQQEGRIKRKTERQIFKTLVGYAEPGNNDNEAACARAYERETDLEYPEA